VLDTEQNEIGLIEDIVIFPEEDVKLIREELDRVYYSPRIFKINSIKERLGYAYFNVTSDAGELEIPLRDVFRSLLRIGEDKIVIIDVDGNRYYIESIAALDKNSQKKLELYV
jgi:L-ribulose-5-phosphate 3-epimerase UlaE